MRFLLLIASVLLFAVSAGSSESILGPDKHEAAAGDLGAVLTEQSDQTLPDCLTERLASGADLLICFTLEYVSLNIRECIDAAILAGSDPVTECDLQ